MSKRPRLERDSLRDLLEVGVSDTALLKLLNKLNKSEPVKSTTFKRHVNAALSEEKELFDLHHLKAIEGDPVQVPVANLPKLLAHFASKNSRYSGFLKQAIIDAGGELSIILYHDDVQSGNILSPSVSKKSTLVYANFLSMPKRLLRSAFTWLPVSLLPHNDYVRIDGGLSALMRAILHAIQGISGDRFLLPSLGLRCSLQVRHFVADFDAQRATYLSRGSAGLRPCVHCANVVKKGSGLSDPTFVEIDVPDLDSCILVSDEDFWSACDQLSRLVASGRTKKDIEDYAMRTGLHHNPESVVFDLHVRHLVAPSKLIPDPMHSYASNGIANQEIMSLWSLLLENGLDSGALATAIVALNFQRAHDTILSRGIRGLFNEKKMCGDLYKGPAWETELVIPLLYFFAAQLFGTSADLLPHLASFQALLLCMRSVRLLLRFPMNDRKLKDCQTKHQLAFNAAYGASRCRPKHHHRLHMIGRPLISCAAMESKHREYKKNLADRLETMLYSQGAKLAKAALPRLVLCQLESMDVQESFQEIGLMHPMYQSLDLRDFLPAQFRNVVPFVSKKANTAFCVVNKGDILFVLDDEGCILECIYLQCCFSVQGSLFFFVEPLGFVKQEHEADHWRRTHRVELRGPPELRYHLHPLLWAWHDDETLLTLW